MPAPTGEWIDFTKLDGGEAYYPAFKKRTIDVLIRKHGKDPEGLLTIAGTLPHTKTETGDVGVIIYPFKETPVLITLWRADEEFGPNADILYDKTITKILCTEDIVVLTELITHKV
jgi:hypothetical protein